MAQQLTRIIRTRIETREWPPGHVFTYPQLAEEFSGMHLVQEVVVRAVRPLREEGLVETRPGVGMRVVIEGESWRPANGQSDLPHDEYIETVLRERLHKNIYRPGEQFPTIRVLAEEFGVSGATVSKALRALQGQGILEVRNSNARFVSRALAEIPAEDLLRPPVRRKSGGKKLPAFGERRTLVEWAWDPRCLVDCSVLRSRYSVGWDLEKAMQTPKTIRQSRNSHSARFG
ncbi:GntR family transcriptional regulator [Streptomyces sp. GESEQ-4]|uniref:GntR family transcriptional regulator n=1 Tax=Streptomyces sp. GESEQ-4 TaxID=2812655 RepID=UPI001B31D14E|nr:GntR family transcriptional regulator [Streptomyces sp. GESEQ-4]